MILRPVRPVSAWGPPSSKLPVGFAGGIPDEATGLVRFGYRDYDPATGRFTARDPLLYGRFLAIAGGLLLLALGANAYITKPIQAPQVIAKVRELLKL